MDNKFNNMLNSFFENIEEGNEVDINEKLQEFMKQYNEGNIDYTNTILDDAYELLEKAENAKSKKQALKFAKEAYELCPDCFDAILFQVNLEENSLKRENLLEEGLEFEKNRLEDEGFFSKENIGHFYGIFETRPYIRGLYTKATILVNEGKINKAKDTCLEMLKLNKHDNLGVRYLLMAIYAYLEEEKELLKLYKKYPEDNLYVLFPLMVIYYKLVNYEEAKKYLEKINKANPHFIKFFKETLKISEDNIPGYYQKGEASEILSYFGEYSFLLLAVPTITEFILENSKKTKK